MKKSDIHTWGIYVLICVTCGHWLGMLYQNESDITETVSIDDLTTAWAAFAKFKS